MFLVSYTDGPDCSPSLSPVMDEDQLESWLIDKCLAYELYKYTIYKVSYEGDKIILTEEFEDRFHSI